MGHYSMRDGTEVVLEDIDCLNCCLLVATFYILSTRKYPCQVRVNILLTPVKHLHDHIIYLRGKMWVHKYTIRVHCRSK